MAAKPCQLYDPRHLAALRPVFAGEPVFPVDEFASPQWLEVSCELSTGSQTDSLTDCLTASSRSLSPLCG